jgi:hypothetical protein
MMEESCATRFRKGNSRGCGRLILSLNVPPAIVLQDIQESALHHPVAYLQH